MDRQHTPDENTKRITLYPAFDYIEYISGAKPGTVVKVGDVLERCEKCGWLHNATIGEGCR